MSWTSSDGAVLTSTAGSVRDGAVVTLIAAAVLLFEQGGIYLTQVASGAPRAKRRPRQRAQRAPLTARVTPVRFSGPHVLSDARDGAEGLNLI